MDATYLSKALKGLDGGKRETLTSFFMCHALCHTVEPVSRLGMGGCSMYLRCIDCKEHIYIYII